MPSSFEDRGLVLEEKEILSFCLFFYASWREEGYYSRLTQAEEMDRRRLLSVSEGDPAPPPSASPPRRQTALSPSASH